MADEKTMEIAKGFSGWLNITFEFERLKRQSGNNHLFVEKTGCKIARRLLKVDGQITLRVREV